MSAKPRRRLFTRGAAIRLSILALLLVAAAVWAYFAMFRMPGASFRGPLPTLDSAGEALRDRLRGHGVQLAGEIGERNCFRPQSYETAARYIEEQLQALGLRPSDELSDRWTTRHRNLAAGAPCRNIAAEIAGSDPAAGVVLIGAHYDTAVGSPGANDNATGVAALIEIARELVGRSPRRTLRFVAFANEEPPFFQTADMGSLVHARACRERGERIEAMISLETIGYYSDEPGSQQYPKPLDALYPDTGNFIGFVGNRASADLLKECLLVFRESTSFPSEGAATFESIPGVGWSDHWSFWQEGYPGIMVTDTAIYRDPHYHTPDDRPEHVDFDRMAGVVGGLVRVVSRLAGAEVR